MHERLESWKEIARHLGRGVRTVRRWEKQEGLPVHRHFHKTLATVYAIPEEVDAWLQSRDGKKRPLLHPAQGALIDGNRQSPGRILLAVLPFGEVSYDAHVRIGDGLTDEIILQLAQLCPERLGVIGRTTVMRYRDGERTIHEIGAELGVEYVLEGVIRHEADRLRITVQMILVANQSQRWAAGYDRAVTGILSLQQAVAAEIAHGVGSALFPAGSGWPPTRAQDVEPAPGVRSASRKGQQR